MAGERNTCRKVAWTRADIPRSRRHRPLGLEGTEHAARSRETGRGRRFRGREEGWMGGDVHTSVCIPASWMRRVDVQGTADPQTPSVASPSTHLGGPIVTPWRSFSRQNIPSIHRSPSVRDLPHPIGNLCEIRWTRVDALGRRRRPTDGRCEGGKKRLRVVSVRGKTVPRDDGRHGSSVFAWHGPVHVAK